MEDFSTKEMTALLGAKFEDITERQKEQLQIPGGARISALGSGKLSQSGVKESFIITKVDGHKVYDSTGLEELMKNKTGGVLIEGVYPNGSKAYYGFGM